MIVQGLVLLWTKGFPSGSAPPAVSAFVSIGGSVGPLPVPWLVPCVAVLTALIALVLARTPYGRRLYALGSNPGAAPLALIDPVKMWAITYAASAFFAAVAGVLLLGFTGSAYGDVGQPYLFQTIAAVVVGGAALVGGARQLSRHHRRRAGADRDQHAADWAGFPAGGSAGGTRADHRAARLALRPRAACKHDDLG